MFKFDIEGAEDKLTTGFVNAGALWLKFTELVDNVGAFGTEAEIVSKPGSLSVKSDKGKKSLKDV
jgi:hypothetical protein